MSERLHYFTPDSSAISVSFDTDGSVSSDVESLDCPAANPLPVAQTVEPDSRRPHSPSERSSLHAQQLQLWSDEARRRRSLASHTRPSATTPDVHHHHHHHHHHSHGPARSPSAKSLRIRITPSSSSKSLVSDNDQDASDSLLSQQNIIQPMVPPPATPIPPSIHQAATIASPGPLSLPMPMTNPMPRATPFCNLPSILTSTPAHVPRPYVPPHDVDDDPVTPDPDSAPCGPFPSDASDASAFADPPTEPRPSHSNQSAATSHSASSPDVAPSSAVKRSRIASLAAAARGSKWSFLAWKKY